jgi:hypothetical protein
MAALAFVVAPRRGESGAKANARPAERA